MRVEWGGGRNRPRREGRVRGEGRVKVGSSSSKSFLYVTFRYTRSFK